MRERHRHGGEDHRDQRGKAQELLGALQRLPDFRAEIANVFHTLADLQLALQPIDVGVEHIARRQIGDEQAIGRAVAGLEEVRSRDVVQIDEQPRTDREQPARDLRFLLDDRAHLERRVADREGVAHLDAEPRRKTRIRPGFTARRNPNCRRSASFAGSTSMIVPRSG